MSSMPSRAGLTTAPPPDAGLAAVLSGQSRPPALARGFARPNQALGRLLDHSRAPVIGVAGTSHPELTIDLVAAMLRRQGRRVITGLGPALGHLDSLGPEDRVLVELSASLLRGRTEGLAMLVLGALAADELAPEQGLWELGEGLRRLIGGLDGCLVADADDARALSLAAGLKGDLMRVSVSGRGADAYLRGDELVILDPQHGVDRRVCRLGQGPLASPALRQHVLLAAAAASVAGAQVEAIREALADYEMPLDRLTRVISRQRVSWYSDSRATRPGQSAASLRHTSGPSGLLVIAGGHYGGQPLDRWREAVRRHAEVVFLFGSAAPVLAEALRDTGTLVVRCADLEDAVHAAGHLAQPGQAVLFSPACEPDDILSAPPGERFRGLLLSGGRRARPRQEAA